VDDWPIESEAISAVAFDALGSADASTSSVSGYPAMTQHPNFLASLRQSREVGPMRGGSKYGRIDEGEWNIYPDKAISGNTRRSIELGARLQQSTSG
jgi:hypothetical protein